MYPRLLPTKMSNFELWDGFCNLKENNISNCICPEIKHLSMIIYAHVMRTLMWHVWNSLMSNNILPKQTIFYMDPKGLLPTRLGVVQHTMITALKVADECGEHYIP